MLVANNPLDMTRLSKLVLRHQPAGGDFSQFQAPTLAEVIPGAEDATAAPPDASKGGGRRQGRQGKGKGKGGKAGQGQDPNQGAPGATQETPPDPVTETTPLEKAKALAKSV